MYCVEGDNHMAGYDLAEGRYEIRPAIWNVG